MNDYINQYTQFAILMLISFSATCFSYGVLYLKNRVQASFFEYLFTEVFSTSLSLSGQAAIALSLISDDQILPVHSVVTMFLSGYTIDSVVNKVSNKKAKQKPIKD